MGRRGRAPEGRFELGGYWLGQESGRPNWFRYWYDPRTGRVRRRSLGTEAFEEAKKKLASHVLTKPREDAGGEIPEPRNVLFVSVMDHYLEHRSKAIRSGEQAERSVQLVSEFLFEVKGLKPAKARADCFGLDLQEDFIRWTATKHSHSASYIARVLNPVAAAMHFAAKEQAVDDADEGRRIVQLMNAAPTIRYDANWIARVAKIEAPQKRKWIPTFEEMGHFMDCLGSELAFRYMILALNTWGRAETIMDLDLKRQVDRRHGLVDLNPPGRLQTDKRRPEIRLTRNLESWIDEWKVARPMTRAGEAVTNIKKAMQAANARWMFVEAGLAPNEIEELCRRGNHKERTRKVQELEAGGAQRITRRVVRSFMATRVRGLKEVRVDREQRQLWLGHLDQDTTSRYEIADPDYLREAAEATDLIIDRIGEHCTRSLWPKSHQPGLPFARQRAR